MAFNYIPTATGLAFHNSTKYIKMLLGPYGSGKSCAAACEVLFNACAQAPASDGIRYCRVGVVRSSYPELVSATRRSLLEVLPSECGTIVSTGSPMRGLYTIPLPDGTTVQLELELWALQTEDDTEKIKSANWTFAWVNEATGCVPSVVTAITSRIGRFPPADMGGATWSGILMDFNMPAPGSWLEAFINEPQDNWEVFRQPPAAFREEDAQGRVTFRVNPDAENLRNLGAFEDGDPPDFTAEQKGMRYYRNQIESLLRTGREDIILNQYCMLPVPIVDGKPVYSNFDRKRHVAKDKIEPVPFHNIIVGIDTSGIHPAAVVMQNQKGQWCILDELYMDNEGFEVFLYGGLVPLLRERYSTCGVFCAIDPSNPRDAWQAITPKERLAEVGIQATTEISNSPKIRIQTVEHMLNLYNGGILVSPNCDMLIRGFESEYRYRRIHGSNSSGGAMYAPQPDKNEYSHLQDAVSYSCLLISQGLTKTDPMAAKSISAMQRHRQSLMRVV